MTRKTWDEFFIDMAKLVASRSKDPSTKVGAVIVDPVLRVPVGMGYNGFPRGVDDTDERYADRAMKYEMVVHAEVNAILNAVRDVHGCTLYSTFMPCPQCAAQLIQAGIKTVYALVNDADERWKAKAEITKQMFSEAGVKMYVAKDDELIIANTTDAREVLRGVVEAEPGKWFNVSYKLRRNDNGLEFANCKAEPLGYA